MPAGAPRKFQNVSQMKISDVVDFPKVIRKRNSGLNYIEARPKYANERAWVSTLMSEYDEWRDLVNMDPASRVELEKPIAPNNINMNGLCRADAIVWHDSSSISIVEGKADCSAVSIGGGVGQLLYYRALCMAYWGVEVRRLLLAARELPPFVLESVHSTGLPFSFLKDWGDGRKSGLSANYGGI